MRLIDLPIQQSAEIEEISYPDLREVKRLADLGLTVGTKLEVVHRSVLNGPLEIKVRDINLVIGARIAREIWVRV